jgi:hypothetical protein
MTGASGAIRSAPGEDCCQVFVLPQFGDLPQRPGRRAVDAWRDPVVVVGTNAATESGARAGATTGQ